ncbi:hypothetical protein CDAR_397901 [Caerostris darwini]|uniref:Uncharacterized protein n=1 Tax=Caerostris darwini TaxID=1538125 RepID=A0AAV4MS94_9ARAC|nr:hypothetical protein CDAR_397901 [Caerostris darwini]
MQGNTGCPYNTKLFLLHSSKLSSKYPDAAILGTIAVFSSNSGKGAFIFRCTAQVFNNGITFTEMGRQATVTTQIYLDPDYSEESKIWPMFFSLGR